MKSKVSDSLPWPMLVGAKFLQVHPVGTIFAILLALPGQVALIASFLLPIKIIMLMASDGMPTFMPGIVDSIDKKMLIGILAGLSIAAFIFHHLTNKAIQAIARSGASRIERRNQKLHLFEGQEELTRNSYTRYIEAVASVNFVLLATVLLFSIYPEVAATLLTYIVACIVGGVTGEKLTPSYTHAFTQAIQKQLPTLANIGFFLTFSWILVDYIFFSVPESFIALLAAIIIGRQLLTQAAAITNSIFFFSRQKHKLRALLFHKEVFQPPRKHSNSIWEFLDSATLSHRQLQEALKSIPYSSKTDAELTWQDSGLPGVGFLIAQTEDSDKSFLVKVFEKNKTTEAHHEAALLLDAPETLPCPKLITCAVIYGLCVHILDITGYSFPIENSSQPGKDEVALSVSQVTIPDALLSRYIRSHSMLWDQLGELQLQQFELVSKDGETVENFLSILPKAQDELKRLPLCLHNPHANNTNIRALSVSDEYQLLHWGRWSLDPAGANLTQRSINQLTLTPPLANSLNKTSTPSPDPMTALLSRQLCQQTKQQLISKALETMKELSNRHT